MDDLPTSVRSATFTFFGVDVKVHVLDDGQRIIEEDSVNALLGAIAADDPPFGVEGYAELCRYIRFTKGLE